MSPPYSCREDYLGERFSARESGLRLRSNPARQAVAVAIFRRLFNGFPTAVALTALLALNAAAQPWLAAPTPHFSDGMSDEEIRDQIMHLVPAVKDPTKSAEQRAVSLREWIHAFIPIADDSTSLGDKGYDHNAPELGRLLHAAEMRIGGYHCGGKAELARKIFQLVGFDTFTINFGIEVNGSTHVSTFVRISEQGRSVWSVQDTYFNFTLRHTDGRLIDYADALGYLENDQLDAILVDDPGYPKTPILYAHPDRVPRLNRRYKLESECVREWDGFEEFRVRWDFRLFTTSMFPLNRDLIARIGRSDPLYLFLIPLGFRGDDSHAQVFAAALSAQARFLQRLGIDASRLVDDIEIPPQVLEPI